MPDGTSIVARTDPGDATAGSVVATARRVGRVWGTGAGYAPRPTTMRAPKSIARSTAARLNARQRWSGSAPTSSSRSLPSASLAARSSMLGHVNPVLTPSTRCIVGRRARWSSSSSLSKTATVTVSSTPSSVERALPAPSPASTHPSSASTTTGDSRSGRSTSSKSDVMRRGSPEPSRRFERSFREGDHLPLERLEARGGLAHRALGVAGVDALHDAGQLPVPERDVEVDLGEVAPGALRVPLEQLGAGEEAVSGRRRGEERLLVPRIGPVDGEEADVGEWIAE